MTRSSAFAIGFTVLFAFHLFLLAIAETHGFVSDRMLELWATGLTHIDTAGFRQTESFYPPLPDTLNLIATWLIPGRAPAPLVLSALLATILSILWFVNLRQNGGYGLVGAGVLTALLVLNPIFLRSVAEGPGTILFLFGTWLYLRGLVNLRIRGSAPDIMKVGLGLVIAVLSHGYGLMVAAAALPCLMLAGRPDQLTNAPFGYLATMVFPVALAGASLMFVSVVFGLPVFTPQPGSGTVTSFGAVIVAIVILLPASLTAILLQAGLMRFWLPLLAGLVTLCGATLMNQILGLLSDPVLIAAPYLSFAVVAIRFWPYTLQRATMAGMMLSISLAFSLLLLVIPEDTATYRWFRALSGNVEKETNLQAAAEVNSYLADKKDILVDIERSPELVVARGGVDGLTIAGQPRYDLAVRTRHADAAVLVLRNATLNTSSQRDRLAHALNSSGFGSPGGYIVTFSAKDWQVYERAEQ